jgi:hypothetical protein
MNSAQAAKSMQQLLSMWAEAYGSQVSPNEETEVEQFSTPPSSPDDNDMFLQQVSGLLDEKFRRLEEQTFKPLFEAVEELNKRCGKVEEALAQRNAETVNLQVKQKSNVPRLNKSSKVSTSRTLPTPISPTSTANNPAMTLDSMKNAMDLFARISQLATTSVSENANSSSSGWDGSATATAEEKESDSEEAVIGEYQGGRNYQYAQQDFGDSKKDREREKEVVVSADPAVVRELKPRPCHK